jgi:hypothetical protein
LSCCVVRRRNCFLYMMTNKVFMSLHYWLRILIAVVNKILNCYANSFCGRSFLLCRHQPSSCARVWLRYHRDSQVSPLCLVLKGCFGQGSTCDPGKLPRWHVRRWRRRSRRWVRWSLRCLRELLLLLSSGAYSACRRSCLLLVSWFVTISAYAVYF